MSSLAEIEAAAKALSREQKQELLRFLTEDLRAAGWSLEGASLVHENDDVLLSAAPGAPPMTPDAVKEMLEDWP